MSNRIQLSDEQIDELLNLVENYGGSFTNEYSKLAGIDGREAARQLWRDMLESFGISYQSARAAIVEYYEPSDCIALLDIKRITDGWNQQATDSAECVVELEARNGDK